MQIPLSEQALHEYLVLGYYSFLLIGVELTHPGWNETEFFAIRIGPLSEADCAYCRDRLEKGAATEIRRTWRKRRWKAGVPLAECVRLKVRAYPDTELPSHFITVPRVTLVGEQLRQLEDGPLPLACKCLVEWVNTAVNRWALQRY